MTIQELELAIYCLEFTLIADSNENLGKVRTRVINNLIEKLKIQLKNEKER